MSSEPTLETISAADFLSAVDQGLININDFVSSEKTASDEGDLSNFSEEELHTMLSDLESGAESEKTASEEAYWLNAGRMLARGYADEMSKSASGNIDLNTLSVEDFIGYAAQLQQAMQE